MTVKAVIMAMLAVTPSLAQTPDAAATVKQFIDAFDRGDTKAAATFYAPGSVSIIDELPPYSWQGPNAFANWLASDALFNKLETITDEKITTGEPIREEITGGRAYVILPAIYTFRQKSVALQEHAQWTFALSRSGPDWKIAGWTWSAPRAAP